MENKATVVFRVYRRALEVDLEIPLNITANDLVIALNQAYDLGIETSDVKNCYLKTENPIALLRGNKLLKDYGIHNGTIVQYME